MLTLALLLAIAALMLSLLVDELECRGYDVWRVAYDAPEVLWWCACWVAAFAIALFLFPSLEDAAHWLVEFATHNTVFP